MTVPPKPDGGTKSPPPPSTAVAQERLPSVPESSSNAYIMMAPATADGAAVHYMGLMTASDSRRSTMSNTSYQSRVSDAARDEPHVDTVGEEVTYAVMEPVAQRVRRENSSRDASTSSLGPLISYI